MIFLKEARKRAGMSQEKLAEMLGLHANTIWNWERWHKGGPNPQQLTRICEVLNVSEAELLHGPQDSKIKITLSWNVEDVRGEIDMHGDSFNLVLGSDGRIGIKGCALFSNRETLRETISNIGQELEAAYDFQILRGKIQEDKTTKHKKN